MDFDALALFLDVARRGGFAPAARDRGVDPSSVSRAVAALEAELGARLLQRSTRRLAPTEAGELLLARLPALLDEWARLRDDAAAAAGGPAGSLRLTASVAFGETLLAPLLPDLCAAFPRLRPELVLTDANLDLVADRIDLALRLAPSLRGDVVGVRLFPTRYRVVASPGWRDAAGPLAGPAALAGRGCLVFALPEFRIRWRFRDAAGAESEVAVDAALVVSSALTLRRAALLGLGPALLADWLVGGDLAAGTLVDLFPGHEATATTFDTAAWLLYPSRAQLPLKTRAVIDFLRARLATARARPQAAT